MKIGKALLLGLAAFLLALLIVLPASWVGRALPDGVSCAGWRGSIWRGQCEGLTIGDGARVATRVTTLRWKLHPLALLRLRVAAQFEGVLPQGNAAGRVQAGSGGFIRVDDLEGTFQLDGALAGALPRGWNGRADIHGLQFTWKQGQLGALGGEVVVSDLADGRGSALGSYRIEFPPSDTPPFTGQLHDTGGPVQLEAQLQLAASRSWTLQGRMRARNPGDLRLARQLEMVGAADAQGWRPVSAEGAFK